MGIVSDEFASRLVGQNWCWCRGGCLKYLGRDAVFLARSCVFGCHQTLRRYTLLASERHLRRILSLRIADSPTPPYSPPPPRGWPPGIVGAGSRGMCLLETGTQRQGSTKRFRRNINNRKNPCPDLWCHVSLEEHPGPVESLDTRSSQRLRALVYGFAFTPRSEIISHHLSRWW